MAQANVDPNMLDTEITDICEKINQLMKRENDIKSNAHTDVDIVEKDNLLRKIRVERRDLNRQLADLSVQKSLMENNVGEVEDNSDEQDEEVDADEVGAADTQDLDDEKADEYNRLHNLLCRTKGDIKIRKDKFSITTSISITTNTTVKAVIRVHPKFFKILFIVEDLHS